jgi:uridine kinase
MKIDDCKFLIHLIDGESGSGKSLLAKLLHNYYDFNGMTVKAIDMSKTASYGLAHAKKHYRRVSQKVEVEPAYRVKFPTESGSDYLIDNLKLLLNKSDAIVEINDSEALHQYLSNPRIASSTITENRELKSSYVRWIILIPNQDFIDREIKKSRQNHDVKTIFIINGYHDWTGFPLPNLPINSECIVLPKLYKTSRDKRSLSDLPLSEEIKINSPLFTISRNRMRIFAHNFRHTLTKRELILQIDRLAGFSFEPVAGKLYIPFESEPAL